MTMSREIDESAAALQPALHGRLCEPPSAGTAAAPCRTAPAAARHSKSEHLRRETVAAESGTISPIAGTGRGGVVSKPDVKDVAALPPRRNTWRRSYRHQLVRRGSPVAPVAGPGSTPAGVARREKMSTRRTNRRHRWRLRRRISRRSTRRRRRCATRANQSRRRNAG